MGDYKEKNRALKANTAQPLADYIAVKIAPILRKKSGFDLALLENWPQIVGSHLGTICTPFKLSRRTRANFEKSQTFRSPRIITNKNIAPRIPKNMQRDGENNDRRPQDDSPSPAATLSLACEGLASLKVQHQADEIIKQVNAFLGYQAVDKIKIVPKSLSSQKHHQPPSRPLNKIEMAWLEEQTRVFDDDTLRKQMLRLGKNIISTS